MDDRQLIFIGLRILDMILEKGLPALIKWQDGTVLENPTAEDFENLKVKTFEEKEEEANLIESLEE